MLNPSQVLKEGTRIENFEIRRELGRGGFGVTYLATEFARGTAAARGDVVLREVALKEFFPRELAWRAEDSRVIPAQTEGAEEDFFRIMKSFLAEAQAIAQIDHANIVRIHSVFESHGTAYFVMPYIEGRSLKGVLRSRGQNGTLTQTEIERLVLPVLDGLEEVHAARIIHRDIKPDNIMIREGSERPVLIDFGAARMRRGDDSLHHTRASEIGAFTEGYAPLEQHSRATGANRHGEFTDVYSFCATLYHCVTGQRPVDALHRALDVQCSRADPLMPVSRMRSGGASYSPALLAAIDWGLELAGNNRPQSVAQLRDCIAGRISMPPREETQLTLVAADVTMPARPGAGMSVPSARPPTQAPPREPLPEPQQAANPPPTRSNRKALYAGIGVLALAASGLAAYRYLPGPEERETPAEKVAAPVRSSNAISPTQLAQAQKGAEAELSRIAALIAQEEAPETVLAAARKLLDKARQDDGAGRSADAVAGYQASIEQAQTAAREFLRGEAAGYAKLAEAKIDAGEAQTARAALARAKAIDALIVQLAARTAR